MADATTQTKLTLDLPTASGLGSLPSSGHLVQAPGAHDVFKLQLTNADGIEALFAGAPVVVRWTSPVGDGAFHGYVHRADPVYQRDRRTASLLLVGASYPLMQPGSLAWTGVRASDVVRDVAFRFGMACDVEGHPLVYPQIVQAGRSYWQLLRELAEEIGYVLRMEGATLVFRSRASLLAHFRPLAPEVPVSTFAPKLGAFNPELGATSASRAATGIDPYQGAVVADRGLADQMRAGLDPIYDQLLTGDVVHSQVDAATAVESAQEANRFTTLASIVGAGNPLLVPERVIWPSPTPSDLTGHWVVRAVEHDFEVGGRYTTRAEVGVDGLGAALLQPGEPAASPTSPGQTIVDPHRPGALGGWPYPEPVLRSWTPVVGRPGRAGVNYAWIAPSTESRTS